MQFTKQIGSLILYLDTENENLIFNCINFFSLLVANAIRDEDHAGNAEVEIIDAFIDREEVFFEALGGGSSEEISESTDEILEDPRPVKLFKVVTSDGEVSITEVAEKPFTQDMLDESVSTLKFTLSYIFIIYM